MGLCLRMCVEATEPPPVVVPQVLLTLILSLVGLGLTMYAGLASLAPGSTHL